MIYIQSDSDRTMPHHFDCACAMYGAIESAQNYRLTTWAEVAGGKFDMLLRNNLFVGSTEFMRLVFSRMCIEDVRLPKNANRKHEIITLKEAHERVNNGKRIFIKPTEIKLFTGLVLDKMQHSCLTGLPDDTEVMVYNVIDNILSEWRVYVHNHKILDSRNYSGDVTLSPEYSYVNQLIEVDKRDFPCAYTMDIGIVADGSNFVVEYNDMWAIGNYGVRNDYYLRALKDRYFEIVKQ